MTRWFRFGRSAVAALLVAGACAVPARANAQVPAIPIVGPAGFGAMPFMGWGGYGVGSLPSVSNAPNGLLVIPALAYGGTGMGLGQYPVSVFNVVGGVFGPPAVTFTGGQGYAWPQYPAFVAYGYGPYDASGIPYANYLPQTGGPSGDIPGYGTAVAPSADRPSGEKMATVSLDVEPANAVVYLDDRRVGQVKDLVALQIPAGRHLLEIRLSGYVPFARGLKLKAGDAEIVQQKLDALK